MGRWQRRGMVLAVLVLVGAQAGRVVATGISGTGGTAPGRAASAVAASQVTRHERILTTFSVRRGDDGAAEMLAQRGDFEVRKRVQPSGEVVLDLSLGRDRVHVEMLATQTVVQRAGTRIVVDRASATDTEMAQVARMLAESNAVRRFRWLADQVMRIEDDSAGAIALLTSDAVVGALSGDAGAPRRVALHLSRRGRARQRPVRLAPSCYDQMETRMVDAWNDFEACVQSTEDSPFYQQLCSWRWLLMVESHWFTFVTCTGFNWGPLP